MFFASCGSCSGRPGAAALSACDGVVNFAPPARRDEDCVVPFGFRSADEVWQVAARSANGALSAGSAAIRATAVKKERSMLCESPSGDGDSGEAAVGGFTGGKVNNAATASAPAAKTSQVHMIVCALDYKKTSCPLTCTADGDNMIELAATCGASVEKLYNEEATVANVSKLIQQVGNRCGPDDYFVFFYAGHGANLPDQDGDEEDGQDEAFCFVDEDGQTSPSCWLRDDDFAKMVTASVHADTKVLILADCCHSGTVADLHKPIWDGYQAISIAGCKDKQTSGDTGKGGIFTHSLLIAIDGLVTREKKDYSVDDLYHETVTVDDAVFASAQDITIQAKSNTTMRWPFVPPGPYVAPLRRAAAGSPISEAAPPTLPTPVVPPAQVLSTSTAAAQTPDAQTPAQTPAAQTPASATAPATKAPQVHMIVSALDYKKTSCPLTCTMDGDNMIELAGMCGASVEKLYNEEATVANVSKLIQQVGSRCGPDDYFVFFYAGHGANLPDQDGDEDDGQDEAFCFVDEDGQTSPSCWLRDDDFAEMVTSSVHADTKVVILSDCCHSGTVADLNKPIWDGYQAISISGCKDKQTSGDTGKGGIFTHSLLIAIDGLAAKEQAGYSVGDLYQETLTVDDTVFASAQDITMKARPNPKLAWPLVPPGKYVAPMRRSVGGGSGPSREAAASFVGSKVPSKMMAPQAMTPVASGGSEALPTLLAGRDLSREVSNGGTVSKHSSSPEKAGSPKPLAPVAQPPPAAQPPASQSADFAAGRPAAAAPGPAPRKAPQEAPVVSSKGGCCVMPWGRKRRAA